MCFLLWPLFARAPCHWFLEFLLLSSLGVQSVFVFVAPRWVPRPFGGARAKKHTTQKTTHHPGCVFLLRPRRKAGEGEAPLGAGTGPQEKKHPGTHSLRAWAAMPPAGVVFFFFSGVVLFLFLLWPRPDAHSLTCFFFLLRPRRTRRANNKKCLVHYIGSKKTRQGHSKKKKKHFPGGRVPVLENLEITKSMFK